jgi:hypothetical protein
LPLEAVRVILDNEFIKPILTLTKTLTGNLQGSNGPLLCTRLSRNVSRSSKKITKSKSKERNLNNNK